jgi:type IV secretion system protein VirB6
MGFFAEFSAWLNTLLSSYISTNTAVLSATLEPLIVTLAVIYVMVWGYLHLTGQIEEPFVAGLKRILVLAVILGCALHLWLYNALIVDTFFNAPSQLASVVLGAFDPVDVIDQIIFEGGDAANLLFQKGGILDGNFAFYLAAVIVYLIVGVTAVYTIFLLSLARIALSVLLALGPLFIGLLFFETTKRFFEAWLAQLVSYAFIAILTVMVAALMLHVVTVAAQQAVSEGGGIQLAEAARLCMAAGLTFLVMRQVMPMAAGLAGGFALSSFGIVSAAMLWGLGSGTRGAGLYLRGLADRDTWRYDPMLRKAGHYTRRALLAPLNRRWRDNAIREGK